MKKTTILIYKDTNAPQEGLREATQKEWSAILQSNQGLPMCQRRCFIEDCFEDCGIIDRMFMEVSYEAYMEWHRENVLRYLNRKRKDEYQHLSIDCPFKESEGESLMDTLADEFDLEGNVVDELLLEELKEQLAQWKPWALELLDFYLNGKKKSCAKELGEKYGITAMAMSKRKKLFEVFLQNFLTGWFNFYLFFCCCGLGGNLQSNNGDSKKWRKIRTPKKQYAEGIFSMPIYRER